MRAISQLDQKTAANRARASRAHLRGIPCAATAGREVSGSAAREVNSRPFLMNGFPAASCSDSTSKPSVWIIIPPRPRSVFFSPPSQSGSGGRGLHDGESPESAHRRHSISSYKRPVLKQTTDPASIGMSRPHHPVRPPRRLSMVAIFVSGGGPPISRQLVAHVEPGKVMVEKCMCRRCDAIGIV